MSIVSLKISDFRCLAAARLEFNTSANLIVGPNGAGKTSVLESIAYLGRGKSFRGAPFEKLVRHGQKEFVLFGVVETGGQERRIGVRNSRSGLETSVNGDASGGTARLAESLPLQVIDPDVHNLVAGGPDERRRYLDWLGFHVEHGYLEQWRRYRRALRQRNAVLKSSPRPTELDTWDKELAASGEQLDLLRSDLIELLAPVLEAMASRLVEANVALEYRRGWKAAEGLGAALRDHRERDIATGSTHSGPHRADLALKYDERQARKLVSRGQQKLLACAMILAGVAVVQEVVGEPVLMLMDDPAAELDSRSLERLMSSVNELGCQVVATALVENERLFEVPPKVFHVEHGVVSDA